MPDRATEGLARLVRSTMAETRFELAGVVETMMVDSGAGELMPAIDSGLVTLSASGFTDDSTADSDAVMDNWLVLLACSSTGRPGSSSTTRWGASRPR